MLQTYGFQGLQEFAFFTVTVMINIRNLGSKESFRGKFKDGMCAELCLKF